MSAYVETVCLNLRQDDSFGIWRSVFMSWLLQAGMRWDVSMSTSGETLYLDLLQTDSAGRNGLNFICACFILFCVLFFCFPLTLFWVFVIWGNSVQIIFVFLIVILDQVLVETCGSIGLEFFVGACPGCARGVVPPLNCVGLLQLPDRVVFRWFCIFLPLQWALEFSFLESSLGFASYWSGFLLECSTYYVITFIDCIPAVCCIFCQSGGDLGWLPALLLVS